MSGWSFCWWPRWWRSLLGPVGVQPAAAQDDLAIQTRVQVLHADPALGQVEVYIN